jgi:hypothetical protein
MNEWMKRELDRIINPTPREVDSIDEQIKNHHPEYVIEKPQPKEEQEELPADFDLPLVRTGNANWVASRELVLQSMELMKARSEKSWGEQKAEAERHYAVIRKVYEMYFFD